MAKILIVDDDPDIVEAMKVVLESKKYEVVAAITWKTADGQLLSQD